jgi:uncharacterized membrane protein
MAARGVSTFLSGLFVILPVAITVAIMAWAGGKLTEMLGPDSVVGGALRSVGLRFVTDERVATVIGWALVIGGICAVGLLAKSLARNRIEGLLERMMNRIPLVGSVYGPVAQVVGMLKKDDKAQMEGMAVVFCWFGGEHGGGGVLGLRASQQTYRFRGEDCQIVYVPTSPVPMSGGILFVPSNLVHKVDMAVDDLMKIYFSLGVLAPQALPERYKRPPQGDAGENTGAEGPPEGAQPAP